MRILYHSTTAPGRCRRACDRETVAALQAAGHQVRLVGPCVVDRRRPRRSPLAALCAAACPALSRLVAGLRDYRRLRRAIRDFKPDVVYARSTAGDGGGGVLAIRGRGIPLLLEVDQLHGEGRGPGGASWLSWTIEAAVVRSADRIIAATGVQKRAITAHGVPPGRVTVCPGAVDGGLFRPDWGRRSGRIRVGCVGTLDREAMGLLLGTIRRVLGADDRVEFLVAGDETWGGRLAAMRFSSQGRVRFVGECDRDGVSALLDKADITLLPAIADRASPQRMLECMAMETAVIAVDAPPVREVIDHGATGLLVARDSPAALAEAVLRLVHEPLLRQRLAANARRAVLQRYTLGAKAQVIADLYREMRLAAAPIGMAAPDLLLP